MSSVIIVQGYDRIYMGSDSAVSVNINDKAYRYSDNGEKLFQIGEKVVFCSGNMFLAKEIVKKLETEKDFTIQFAQKISIQKYQEYIENKRIKQNEFALELVIGVLEDNQSVVYQISPYNNFDIVRRTVEQNQLAIWTGGLKTEIAFKTMHHNLKTKKYIYDCFKETFSNLVCEEIGGLLTVYKLKTSVSKVIDKKKINEKRKINRIEDEFEFNQLNLVVAERLYGQVIVGENLEIGDEEGTFIIVGNLLTIKDRQDIVRLLLGEYENNKFGLKLFNKSGHDVILDEDGILQSWQEGRTDNVDANNGLSMYVYIPEETLDVRMAKLRFKLLPFRSYSRTTESGGQSTQTSSSGGGTTITSASGGGVAKSTNSGGGTSQTSSSAGSHRHEMFRFQTDTSQPSTWNNYIAVADPQGQSGAGFVAGGYQGSFYTRESAGSHSHSITIPNHSHDFDIPNHTHSITVPNHTHSVSIPSHNHEIQHGIYTSTAATGVSIYINNINRTSALGGKFYTDENNLDITQYLAVGTWNEILLTSDRLGRINANLFIQIFSGT